MPLMEARVRQDAFGAPEAGASLDAERYRSVRLALIGRFMRSSNKAEYPAMLSRISVERLTVTSPVVLSEDESVIAYFEHVGGLEGRVTRVLDNGFEMCLNITTRKREKLAAQLTWLINRDQFDGLEERRHERFAVGNKMVALRIGDAPAIECTLLDISLSGASLETSVRPEIGTEVVVGKQVSVVRRHHEQGIGVQFLQVQEAKHLQGYLK